MANKRVIDLAELSQTVQEGQYILVDSAGGTGKMDLKQIIDDIAVDPEGVYPDLIAGDLDTDKHQTNSVPYLFRPSASVGTRAYETIVGASVGENQLCNGESVTVPNGRKYYLKTGGTESLGASTGTAITGLTSGSDMVIDLTQMLGSAIADYVYSLETATAGSGIAKLREWGFLRGYQAHNAGAIESVEVTGKKVVGFNQWNEEWEVGGYADATGNPWNTSDRIRSKTADYIAVIPNTDYYFRGTSSLDVYWYDADKAYIGHNAYTNNTVHTSPNNAQYMRFATYATYGTTYNNDICINLSSDRNGEYEPYKSTSYELGSDTLRGIFKLDANNNLYADGDRKTSDGVITRKMYEMVFDGSENFWTEYPGKETEWCYANNLFDGKLPKGILVRNWGICNNMECVPNIASGGYAGAISTSSANNSKNLYVAFPSGITSLSAFKTWLGNNNTHLVYELATPTTEQSTPFTSPQVCYPDGTEEFVTENGVPVGHNTDYSYSIKALAEELIDIPDVPTANGTYVLKATRSSSGITYAWVTG